MPSRKAFLRSGDGHKVEGVTVAQKMRQAKNGARIRRFTLNEFLRLLATFNPSSPAQSSETDTGGDPQRRHNKSTTNENQASSNAFIMVLESLIYASLDICEYFDLAASNIPRSRKAPYIELKTSLV